MQGLKSRAAFKILEMDQKYRLFRSGQTVVDLASFTTSWLGRRVADRLLSRAATCRDTRLVAGPRYALSPLAHWQRCGPKAACFCLAFDVTGSC